MGYATMLTERSESTTSAFSGHADAKTDRSLIRAGRTTGKSYAHELGATPHKKTTVPQGKMAVPHGNGTMPQEKTAMPHEILAMPQIKKRRAASLWRDAQNEPRTTQIAQST